MDFRKIVAIVRSQVLAKVEDRLVNLRIEGISVSRVKGYGEAANFVNPEWEFPYARIELFCESGMAADIVEIILDAAHLGFPGDGLVAVEPVEHLYQIQRKCAVSLDGI